MTARFHPLLRPLLTSPIRHTWPWRSPRVRAISFKSIPAASTTLGLLPTGFAVMCLLTRPMRPRYAVPVRRYGLLQSRFLQCRGRPLPPCALLTGFGNSPARDLHPLDIQRTTLPCGSVLGPCRAHTRYCQNGGLTCKLGALSFYSSVVLVDSFVLRNTPERKVLCHFRATHQTK